MQEIYIDTERFNSVWNRVTSQQPVGAGCGCAAPAAACPPEFRAVSEPSAGMAGGTAQIKKFMDDAGYIIRCCCAAANKCPGRIARTLSCVAENERKHLKRLKAEYFVMTGCTYCPDDTRIAVCTVSESLRAICAKLADCASEYYAAADTAPAAQACTYRNFARDEEKNAGSVLCLIEGMI